MVAMEGARDMSRERALEVCPLARFSKKRPREMKVMSMVLVSKSVLGLVWGGKRRETTMAMMLKKKAQEVPRTIKTSMVGEPCLSDFHAEI